MFKFFSHSFHIIVATTCSLSYLVALFPPSELWYLGMVSFAIPIVLLINILFFLILIMGFNPKSFYYGIALLIGFSHLNSSFALNLPKKEIENKITVLNYNVRVFNVYKHLRGENHDLPKKQINWVANHEADVKCLQEYYDEGDSKIYNTKTRIGKKMDYYAFVHSTLKNRIGASFGMAIFSKYKIVNKGVIDYLKKSNNDVIFADIKIKNDTIRVYNAHLQSLSIEEGEIESIYTEQPKRRNYLIRLLNRFKIGFIERSRQVDLLYTHIENCPYPVILCGDFNDLPYSYTYQKIDDLLENSFVEAGNGLGFTHNGKIPFLRIDNQFFSEEKLNAYNFKIDKSINYSDHFPLVCDYELIK